MQIKKNKVKADRDSLQVPTWLCVYVIRSYKVSCFFVLVLVTISSLATVASSLFPKSLIDGYITPIPASNGPMDFGPLFQTLCAIAAIYVHGIASTYLYARILIDVAQGTMKRIRDDLFVHMEGLPVRYSDMHHHNDIMSVYTNGTDTLQQVISQNIPQLLLSAITVVSIFLLMCVLSLYLTIIVVAIVIVMKTAMSRIVRQSAVYFKQQQSDLDIVNGHTGEMMSGQKVIKMFTHEQETKDGFDQVNKQLSDSIYQVDKFASILMPVMRNLGSISYVLTALLGGLITINGIGGLTLGALASFLQLSRSFTIPITQISQQLSSVIMTSAGASRIFVLMDEGLEADDGLVTLARVQEADGGLIKGEVPTGKRA